jgi:3-hydroxybutyryl-CoA dehydrogenase
LANQPNPLERLGIAGSGSIACGLARLAGERHEVVLWARSDESAARARAATDGAATVVTDLGALNDCDVVVEAIAEDSGAKTKLLSRLGAELPEAELLATTTSSLSVTELARASGRADRFAGLHVFNPVEKMRLVELAFPPEATAETRERFHALCEWFGKQPVEVPDIAGFVVNRLLFPYLFSAVRLLEETDLEPAAVDDCMKYGAGHPMGPLALLDLVGLDVSAAIGEAIGAEIPERMQALIDEGKLGRKSGAGFYSY